MLARTIALFLLTCAFAFAAPSAKPGAAKASLPAAAPAKQVLSRTDAQIEQAARMKFAASKIAEDKFTVRVHDGIAVIEGNTNVIQRKGVASRLAKLSGARAIDNRIKISEEARRVASQRLAEGRKKAAAKRAAKAEAARLMPKTQAPSANSSSSKAPSVKVPVAKAPAVKAELPAASASPKVVVAQVPAATVRRAQIKH